MDQGRRATVQNSKGRHSSQISLRLSLACGVMWLPEFQLLIWVLRAKIISLPHDTVFSIIVETVLVVCSQQILVRMVRSIISEAKN